MLDILESSSSLDENGTGRHPSASGPRVNLGSPVSDLLGRAERLRSIPDAPSFATAFRRFNRVFPLKEIVFGCKYSKTRREKRLTEMQYFGFRRERLGHWIGSVPEAQWSKYMKKFMDLGPPSKNLSSILNPKSGVTSKKKRKWGLSRKKQAKTALFCATASYNRAAEYESRLEGRTNLPDFSYTLDYKGELVQAFNGKLRTPPSKVDDFIAPKKVGQKVNAADRLLAYRRKTEYVGLRRWYLGTKDGFALSEENKFPSDPLPDVSFWLPEGKAGLKLRNEAVNIDHSWTLLNRNNARVMVKLWKHNYAKSLRVSQFRDFNLFVPPPREATLQIEDLFRYLRGPAIAWRRRLSKFYQTALHPNDPLVQTFRLPDGDYLIEDQKSEMMQLD
jgi:hypothetical protein